MGGWYKLEVKRRPRGRPSQNRAERMKKDRTKISEGTTNENSEDSGWRRVVVETAKVLNGL